jgi:hypothetical protein
MFTNKSAKVSRVTRKIKKPPRPELAVGLTDLPIPTGVDILV